MTALPSSGSFAMVDPTHVAEVGPAAALLYARISWRASAADGGAWRATRRELRDETGLSEAMLRTAAKTLRDEEWVTAERTSADDSTLIWRPLCPADQHMDASTPPPGGIIHTPLDESSIPSSKTGETFTPTPDGESLFDPPQLRSVPTPSELDEEFARFWELYPRRTGKKAARTAYGRARRTASVQAIAFGLRAQLPSLTEREPQYVPHPATWLNQGRWEDEVPTAPQRDAFAGGELPPPPRTDLYG